MTNDYWLLTLTGKGGRGKRGRGKGGEGKERAGREKSQMLRAAALVKTSKRKGRKIS